MLWFLTRENYETNERLVRDWLKYPELRWIDRHDFAAPALLALVLYMVGAIVGAWWPATGSTGWQFVVWGFVVSTVVLYHVTYSINSIAHRFGTRRFATPDDSRNNWLLAVVTFGEGWHNNHHHYPAAARQGFFWWEIDLTWYALVLLSWCGLVWDLKGVPARALAVGQVPPTNGSRT